MDNLEKFVGMPASDFVPHRKPMLFLDTLVDIGQDFAACEWRTEDDFDFIVPGRGVPAYAGIEYMAQCVAVHAGARARLRGFAPPLGYLLGTRHFHCSVGYFEPGKTYRAHCEELVRDDQGMGSFACHIEKDGEELARANLAVLERLQEIRLE